MLRPHRLSRGSRIAVVAPASPFQRNEFDSGVAELSRLGFEPVWDDAPAWTGRILAERARGWGWTPSVDLSKALAEIREGLRT